MSVYMNPLYCTTTSSCATFWCPDCNRYVAYNQVHRQHFTVEAVQP